MSILSLGPIFPITSRSNPSQEVKTPFLQPSPDLNELAHKDFLPEKKVLRMRILNDEERKLIANVYYAMYTNSKKEGKGDAWGPVIEICDLKAKLDTVFPADLESRKMKIANGLGAISNKYLKKELVTQESIAVTRRALKKHKKLGARPLSSVLRDVLFGSVNSNDVSSKKRKSNREVKAIVHESDSRRKINSEFTKRMRLHSPSDIDEKTTIQSVIPADVASVTSRFTTLELKRINEVRRACRLDHRWADYDIQRAINTIQFVILPSTFAERFPGRDVYNLYQYLKSTILAG